jgi:hypothetical protein
MRQQRSSLIPADSMMACVTSALKKEVDKRDGQRRGHGDREVARTGRRRRRAPAIPTVMFILSSAFTAINGHRKDPGGDE